jgi:hypothetical protein
MTMTMTMTTFGFLHTADVHVAVFDHLLLDISPADRAVHTVDASLLTDAIERHGVDDDLRTRIGTHLLDLRHHGAVRVVCTCSTIGASSEEVGRTLGLDVTRVDRAMARTAVRRGDRIAIVAALGSTMGPTRALLAETAQAERRRVQLVDAPCLDAWSHFASGNHDGYFAALAAHLASIDASVDVIVLAQASMAPVQDLVALNSIVLSSPRLAVEDLVNR